MSYRSLLCVCEVPSIGIVNLFLCGETRRLWHEIVPVSVKIIRRDYHSFRVLNEHLRAHRAEELDITALRLSTISGVP